MIQKISTKELKPGMQVVNLDLPWLSNPFLYAIEGVIDSQEEINRIISEGTLQKLRENSAVSTESIAALCAALDCQPGDIMEYVPEISVEPSDSANAKE